MTEQSFVLPDVGEGLIEAEIVTWKVRVGDIVILNQPLVDVETAKAIVELPSPFAGQVLRLHANEGDTVAVGDPLVTIEAVGRTPVETDSNGSSREAVLTGYGVANEDGSVVRRNRRATLPPVSAERSRSLRASPPARRLAKERGVNLSAVVATGHDGVITRADVAGTTTPKPSPFTSGVDVASKFVGRTLPAYQDMADEERIPMKGVLKSMAEAMVTSVTTAPQASVWLRLDATKTMERVAQLKADERYGDVRFSPLAIVALGLIDAVRHFPGINSYVDEVAGEVVVRRSVNVGIAADTPRGLVVPNIKGAEELDVVGVARGLAELVTKARSGALTPQDMLGTSITITNVGPFGVDGGVPILPPGTGAILCIGQIAKAPWVINEGLAVRYVAELSLTFDHRQIDGALASAVVAHVAAFLREPPTVDELIQS